MRRCLTTIAAAALIMSSVGSAFAVEPVASSDPAATIEPGPSVDPSPSANQSPSANPSPSVEPAASPGDPSPRLTPTATPAPVPSAATNVAAAVAPPGAAVDGAFSADPTGRWIVVLKGGTNAATRSADQGRRLGFKADRTFGHAIRGYSARLSRGQVAALRGDPSVAMIVPDEKIQAEAQTIPTGISRVGATRSSVSQIDGVDQRVDADVAIVDTGIGLGQTDLNVVGGYNCSSATTTAWRDVYGHGTHVAGTVGAIDNGDGVVGVAPGVRLWAVKILNDSGEGLLSWYVCGLDWIAAQHDPNDPTRPLFEAVNMSVTKWGRDDGNCGNTTIDILHRAICRLVASGVTVVAAAANDSGNAALRVPAAYSEVITVSALADTDGQPGGLGGHRCFSWGTYDYDDTFADFSNYGPVVDLIAPGKCIWSTIPGGYAYMSGTSMAAPHVTGAVALLKATRPGLTPDEVKQALQYMGNLGWKTATDPDRYHEKLLDVTRIGPRGDFAVSAGPNDTIGEAGGAAQFPITVIRTATSFELIRLRVDGLASGMTATFSRPSLYGFGVGVSTLTVNVPFGTPPGSYQITVSGDEHGNTHAAPATIVVRNDIPTAMPPTTSPRTGAAIGSRTLPIRVSWAPATDPSTGIAGYELQMSVDGGTWTAAATTSGTVRTVARTHTFGHLYQYRLRARDAVGNWSGWAYGPTFLGGLIQDRSSAVVYRGTWRRATSTAASGGTVTYATAAGALARTTFTGRAVAIVAPVGPTRGSAAIYIDGTYRGTLSFRARSGLSRDVVYAAAFPTLATHTIELRLVGNGRVDLDAFAILR